MRTTNASTPNRTQWRVRVVWQPRWRVLARSFGGWRRKRRSSDNDAIDTATGVAHHTGDSLSGVGGMGSLADEFFIAWVVVIAGIAAGALFWWLLLPLLLLVVDLVVVVALLGAAIVARVLLRRPWVVEAATRAADGAEEFFSTEVVGWRAALRTRDEIADRLRDDHSVPVVGHLSRRHP